MAYYVKPNGHIYSYEIRDKAIKQAKKNIKKAGLEDYVTIEKRDVIENPPDIKDIDAAVLDLATPWLVIPKIYPLLKSSGICCSFSPVIEQVKKTHQAMLECDFRDINTYELLKRQIQVKRSMNATRPETRMIGHTGYITFGRKVISDRPEEEIKIISTED